MLTETEYYSLFTHRRESWDPDEERARSTRSWEELDVAEVHHTGARGPRSLSTADKRAWLLLIERFHEITKRWSDIFYHIFIFADGTVYEGRPPLRTSQSNISDAITVHIPGNDTGMTEPQFASFMRVVHAITDGDPSKLRDHQGRPASTTCCGGNNRVYVRAAQALLPTYGETMTTLADTDELIDWAEEEVARFFGDGDLAVLSDPSAHPATYDNQLLLTILGRYHDRFVSAALNHLSIAVFEAIGEVERQPGPPGKDGESPDIDQVVEVVKSSLEGAAFDLKQEATITFQ